MTPECYADALVLLLVRDRDTDAALNWSTQINYMIGYNLFRRDEVQPATREYMVFPPPISILASTAKAAADVGHIAERGKLRAEWAK